MDSLMNIIHFQINRIISSVISDRVSPELHNIMGSLSTGQRDSESGTSVNNQDTSEKTNGLNTKITKKGSRSAFDLRDTSSPQSTTQPIGFLLVTTVDWYRGTRKTLYSYVLTSHDTYSYFKHD